MSPTIRQAAARLARAASVVCALLALLPTNARAQVDYRGEEPASCLQEPRGPKCRSVRIDAILVEGLGRTERHVITRELLFEEGGYASERQLAESMARLRNMGLFREVRYQLVTQTVGNPKDAVEADLPGRFPARVLRIVVDERWTLLPAFSYLQGGGLSQLVIAAYDINVGGRYIELGAQYERLGFSDTFWQSGGAANSFFLWARDPRFLDTRLWTGLDIARQVRLRSLYTEDGQLEGGFTQDRVLVRLSAQRELLWWLRVGAGLDFYQDSYSFDLIPATTRAAHEQRLGNLPPDGRAIPLSATLQLGRVNQDDFRYDGWRVFHTMSHSDPLWGADFRFTRLVTDATFYKKTPLKGNVAARLRVGLGNARQLQHLYYVGGLDRVRGFYDSRFRGRNYWTANLEYRQAVFTSQWFVLQPIVFFDAGGVSERPGELGTLTAASTGGGVRFILPNVYGFVGRIDYAVPLVKNGDVAISLGAQQFF